MGGNVSPLGSRAARAVIRAEIGHGTAELVGDPDRPHGWTLLVDGTAQSHVDLDDPTHLEFEYIRRIGHLIDLCAPPYAPAARAAPRRRRVDAGPLRGGHPARARPRPSWSSTARWPSSSPTACPPTGWGSTCTVGDARAALAATAPARSTWSSLDVFAGARTPAHLTSAQFAALVARTLAPGGAYAANVADGGPALDVRGHPGGRGPRRLPARRRRRPARRPARPPVRQPRAGGVGARLPRRRPAPQHLRPTRSPRGCGRARPRPVRPRRPAPTATAVPVADAPPRRPSRASARRGTLERAVGARPSRRWPGARRTSPRSTTCRSSRRSRSTSRGRQRAPARRRRRPTRRGAIGVGGRPVLR